MKNIILTITLLFTISISSFCQTAMTKLDSTVMAALDTMSINPLDTVLVEIEDVLTNEHQLAMNVKQLNEIISSIEEMKWELGEVKAMLQTSVDEYSKNKTDIHKFNYHSKLQETYRHSIEILEELIEKHQEYIRNDKKILKSFCKINRINCRNFNIKSSKKTTLSDVELVILQDWANIIKAHI